MKDNIPDSVVSDLVCKICHGRMANVMFTHMGRSETLKLCPTCDNMSRVAFDVVDFIEGKVEGKVDPNATFQYKRSWWATLKAKSKMWRKRRVVL